MQDIQDKVVIITGASSGIGEAIARQLAAQGAKVVLGARRTGRLAQLAKDIQEKDGQAAYAETDVAKREHLFQLAAFAKQTFGRADVLVSNAGISHLSRLDEGKIEEWEEMIDINLKGVLYGIAAVMPLFKEQGSGHIINIISTSGIKIVPLQGVYAATKNAVRTLSEALRQESGGKYRVTGISPGFVQTELTSHIKDEATRTALQEKAAQIAISPYDIAAAVSYAISQPQNVDVGDIVIRPSVQE